MLPGHNVDNGPERDEPNTTSASSDLLLVESLFLDDSSLWFAVQDVVGEGLSLDSQADHHQKTRDPVRVLDLCLSTLAALSVAVTKAVKEQTLMNSSSVFLSQTVLRIAHTCWCGIRFQYPRHSDLRSLVTQMTINETILLAEASLMMLRQNRHSGHDAANADTMMLPSFLGTPQDFITAALIHWQEQGIYSENSLQLSDTHNTLTARPDTNSTSLDDILPLIRCHWVTILFLLEESQQTPNSGLLSSTFHSLTDHTSGLCSTQDLQTH
jgi:hypothetical protein